MSYNQLQHNKFNTKQLKQTKIKLEKNAEKWNLLIMNVTLLRKYAVTRADTAESKSHASFPRTICILVDSFEFFWN